MTARSSATVTILFCDVVGSTEVLAHRDEQADAVRRALFAALRKACRAHDGEEVKSLGDGLMVAFRSAADALGAGAAMQQAMTRLDRRFPASLRLRVGISTGDCTCDDDDYFGPAVVEASRLCEAAGPGEILLTQLVSAVARSPELFPVEALGPRPLRGLGAPVEVGRLGWQLPEPPVPMHPVLVRSDRSPLVGRQDELVSVAAALEAATAEGRQTVLVTGEPGIGKTRLVAAVASTAYGAGTTVLYGRCDAGLAVAYQPVTEALRALVEHVDTDVLAAHAARHGGELTRLVPELAQRVPGLAEPLVGDPEGDRLRLFEAIDDLLCASAAEAPVVVIVDDLHWAARPTLLLLDHLVRSVRSEALVLIATYRDTELDREHPLTPVLGDLRRVPTVRRVALGGLTEDEIAQLLERAAGRPLGRHGAELAQMTWVASRGLAFFVAELVEHLVASGAVETAGDLPAIAIPDSVREVVRGRVARLEPATRELLAAAAVVGDDFSLDVVTAMVGASGATALDAAEEARRQRLIVEAAPEEGRYSFGHTLVRVVVHDDLAPGRRATLHRRAAEAVERLHGPDGPSVTTLAYHFAHGVPAGTAAPAVRYALAAADRALEHVAYEQAADVLEVALAALDRAPDVEPADRADLLLRLAATRVRTHDHDGVRDAGMKAARAARLAGSPGRLAEAAVWYSARAVAGEHNATGIALCEEALGVLGPAAQRERALVLAALATQRAFAGDAEGADAASREALRLAADTGDRVVEAHARYARYYTLWGSERIVEQLALAEQLRASDVVMPTGLLASLDAHRLRTYPCLVLGRRDDFVAAVAEVARIAEEVRSHYFGAVARMWEGCHRLLEGRFEEFDTMVGATSALVGDDPNFRNAISAQAFHRHFEGGRLGDLVPLLASVADQAPGLSGFRAALGLARLHAGDEEGARSVMEDLAADGFAGISRDVVWPVTMAVLAELCVGLGDKVRAETLSNLLRPYSGQLVVLSAAYAPGSADRYLGMLALLNQRWDTAEARLRAALDLEERMGARPLAARTQAWYATMLRQRGRAGDESLAGSLAAGAAATAEELGMSRLALEARALL